MFRAKSLKSQRRQTWILDLEKNDRVVGVSTNSNTICTAITLLFMFATYSMHEREVWRRKLWPQGHGKDTQPEMSWCWQTQRSCNCWLTLYTLYMFLRIVAYGVHTYTTFMLYCMFYFSDQNDQQEKYVILYMTLIVTYNQIPSRLWL